jgi:predicted PurR-regulated permease PerM
VVSSVFAALFLGFFEIIKSLSLNLILVAVSIYMIWQFIDLLQVHSEKNNYKRYSILLDIYFLLVLLLLISDRIIM